MTNSEIKVIHVFERLKAAMQLKNDAALARVLGVKPSKLSVWKLRNYIPYKILTTYCSHNNLNLDWIIHGEGQITNKNLNPPFLPRSTYPVLRRVPPGFPKNIPQEVIEYIRFPGEPKDPYALVVKCECLSPVIKNGDLVVFDPEAEVRNGDIVLVNDEWYETTLRRYCIKEGEIFLVSDNYEYPTVKFTENYKIIGKVIDAWRRIGL